MGLSGGGVLVVFFEVPGAEDLKTEQKLEAIREEEKEEKKEEPKRRRKHGSCPSFSPCTETGRFFIPVTFTFYMQAAEHDVSFVQGLDPALLSASDIDGLREGFTITFLDKSNKAPWQIRPPSTVLERFCPQEVEVNFTQKPLGFKFAGGPKKIEKEDEKNLQEEATSNRCHASSNRCLTSSNKKLQKEDEKMISLRSQAELLCLLAKS